MKTLASSDFLGRDNNLTLVRFVAALAVIYGHSFAMVFEKGVDPISTATFGYTYSGTVAVSMFFALSGFLVTRSYFFSPDLAEWTKMRVARIYPGAIVSIFVMLFYAFAILGFHRDFWTSSGVVNFIQTNVTLSNVAFDIGHSVFLHNRMPDSLVGSWWTLPGEIRVYLLFAALAVAGTVPIQGIKQEGLRNIAAGAVVLGLLALSYADFTALPVILDHPSYASPTRYFLLGIMFFLLRKCIILDYRIFVGMLLLPYTLYSNKEGFLLLLMFSTTYAVFYIGYGLKNFGFDRVIGDWSYGIYIYGWFAQQVVASFSQAQSPFTNFLLSSLFSIALGAASWRLVEKPSLQLARRLIPRRMSNGS